MPKKIGSTFSLSINGHGISGRQRRGRWYFHCDTWPELSKSKTLDEAIGAFTRLALAGAVMVRELAEEVAEPRRKP